MTQRAPLRDFKTSPDIIRFAVMLCILFLLSLRNVEDLLHERPIEISRETARSWWNLPTIDALGQNCGMDREDTIAFDLRGNVMTCQNTGAQGVQEIGQVAEFDDIALDTSTHFPFRKECIACPVVQLCKGSCMFLEGQFFNQSCAKEFAFNMGIMMAAVWHLTGMVVVELASKENIQN